MTTRSPEVTPTKTVRVNVPQKDGQITITVAGGESQTFSVTDGVVTAPDRAAADLLVAYADGVVADAKS